MKVFLNTYISALLDFNTDVVWGITLCRLEDTDFLEKRSAFIFRIKNSKIFLVTYNSHKEDHIALSSP